MVLYCCVAFVLTSILAIGVKLEKGRYSVQMVLQNGNSKNVKEMWSGTGLTYSQYNHSKENNLTLAIYRGEFRSETDSLEMNTFDMISLTLCNAVGDVLWWISFNASDADSDILSWMQSERVIDWSYNSAAYDVHINTSAPEYQLYMGPNSSDNKAWFAVKDSQEGSHRNPLLLFSPEHAEPMNLSKATNSTELRFLGCWFHDQFIGKEYQSESFSMTVNICIKACRLENKEYTLLEMGYKCHCGNLRITASSANSAMSKCNVKCYGDSSYSCGGESNWFATYTLISNQESQSIFPDVVESTESVSYSFSSTLDIITTGTINSSNYSGYITAVYITPVSLNFSLYYHPVKCDYSESKPYPDMAATPSPSVKVFESGKINNLTLTPAKCLWIVRYGDPSNRTPMELTLYYPKERTVFMADYLAIIGVYSERYFGTISDQLPHTSTASIASYTALTINDLTGPSGSFNTTVIKSTESPSGTTNEDAFKPSYDDISVTSRSTETTWIISATDKLTETTDNTYMVTHNTINIANECFSHCCNETANDINITEAELQAKLKKIRAILRIDKRNLSSTIRKLVSAWDNRASSKSIGGIGVVILLSLITVILAIDIDSLVRKLFSETNNSDTTV